MTKKDFLKCLTIDIEKQQQEFDHAEQYTVK